MSKVPKNAFGQVSVRADKQTVAKVSEPPKTQLIAVRKLLLEEKSEKVIKKLLQIALDDEHSGQMAAIKMAVDRMLPVSEFEKASGSSRPTITINIGGVNEPDVIDGEVKEV